MCTIDREMKMKSEDVYMVAFDHEVEFDALFVKGGSSTDAERSEIRRAKKLVMRGVQKAVADGVTDLANAAILIDELYGSDVADEARETGLGFSMPVDPPGREFTFRFDDWQDHLLRYQPTWAKPLLWYNVDGDKAKNARQVERVKVLADWLAANDQKLLLEFLIPAEPAQEEATGGDRTRYETEYLPRLITEAMKDLVAAGVEPDLWKVEGVPTAEGMKLIGDTALSIGKRTGVLVLGRGAGIETVGTWLSLAGATPGFSGFAVGRTIWNDAVGAWIGNQDDTLLIDTIADRYRQLVDFYQSQK
jgi:myo-inositol catabolism protein IolC